jgi:hypothetical protein
MTPKLPAHRDESAKQSDSFLSIQIPRDSEIRKYYEARNDGPDDLVAMVIIPSRIAASKHGIRLTWPVSDQGTRQQG